ncbi:MAG: isochorismatase family cysteine hydrolase [Anaerolineales bacterium]|jgi:nicotinamidase-related amidase
MKPALLVIDVQKAFFKDNPPAAAALRNATEYINAAIELFRKKNLPVICVQHMNPEDNLVPGQEGFDLPESLKILPTDVHIHKTYPNAFNKTTLAELLRKEGVDTIVVTGFAAEGCVLSTCRGAKDLDLTAIILRNSIVAGKPENAPFVESINEIISYGALEKVLE